MSTGELDSNWSVLPGGQALQAQLHVMYENKGFMEYLCVLERSILQLWAEATEPPTLKQTSQAREKGRTSPPHAKTRARESDRSRNKDEGGDDDDASHLLTSADDMWDYEIGKPVDVFAARSGPGKALSRAFSADEVSQLWKKFIVTANGSPYISIIVFPFLTSPPLLLSPVLMIAAAAAQPWFCCVAKGNCSIKR